MSRASRVALGVGLALGLTACAATSAATFDAGVWRVAGEQLTDAQGRRLVLHGLNSSGLEFGTGAPATAGQRAPFRFWHAHSAQEFDQAAAWGFNVIRLAISWANLEPQAPGTDAAGHRVPRYNDSYLAAIDEAVRLAGRAGLPVVLSMHHSKWSSAYPQGGGMPPWLYAGEAQPLDAERAFLANRQDGWDQYLAVWVMLAKRYASTSNLVGLDVFNEAQRQETEPLRRTATGQLEAFYDRAASTIRAANPRLVLILQDFADRDPRLGRLPAVPGVIYSFHSYPPWVGPRLTAVDTHLARAKAWGVPAWIGELSRSGDAGWQPELAGFLQRLKDRQVAWAYWAYQYHKWPLFGFEGRGPVDEPLLAALRAAL